MPQALTLILTSPGPGTGISRSISSKSPPGLVTCATRFFANLFLRRNVGALGESIGTLLAQSNERANHGSAGAAWMRFQLWFEPTSRHVPEFGHREEAIGFSSRWPRPRAA